MLSELTIEQAKKSPAAFMYVWASDQFLNAIYPQYAKIISVKRANEKKLLMLSAKKYLGDENKWSQYTDAIRQAFISEYEMTPAEALVTLAQGGQVAGKNWSEGVFGIGATPKTTTYYGASGITTDETTGAIYANGSNVTDSTKTVYATAKNGSTVAYQQFYTDADGNTYMSQYDKKSGKYYSQTVSKSDGTMINAATGAAMSGADGGDLWGNIVLIIQQFIDWLISLFGGNSDKELLSAENTLPSQTTDGFVSKAGIGEGAALLLLLAGGGVLLAGGLKKKKASK